MLPSMFKRLVNFLPPFFITALQLFLLEFLMLGLWRVAFYICFKTTDSSALSDLLILKAFGIGCEFDLVATSYAVLLPTVLLLLNDLFQKKSRIFHTSAFLVSLLIFWLYALVSSADFPYFHQFGSHLNRQAFLWAASPGFVFRLIFGTLSYY